jgi:hypothetical protein
MTNDHHVVEHYFIVTGEHVQYFILLDAHVLCTALNSDIWTLQDVGVAGLYRERTGSSSTVLLAFRCSYMLRTLMKRLPTAKKISI